MSSAGELAARLSLDAAGFKAEMAATGQVSERELNKIQKQVKFVTDYIKEMEKAQKQLSSSATVELPKASHAMEELSFHSAGAKRELLVLTHELSQGNFARFGGSLLVLGERTGAAALLFSGMGAAVLAAGGALLGFVAAAVKGHEEQDALNKSLVATGNFAGVTSSSFEALARSISGATGQSLTKSKDALQGLISTGQIGPAVLGQMATAVQLVAHNTGAMTSAVVSDFAKMAEAPAKWAEEHNKAWHFVSAEQYAYIKRLEDQGEAEKAALTVSQKVVDHFSTKLAPNLGYIEQAWKGIAEWSDKAWENMKGIGKTDTVDAQLAKVERDLKVLAARKSMNILAGTPDANPGDDKLSAKLTLQREGLMRDKQMEAEVAWRASLSASTEKARIAAVDYINKIADETKGTTLATREIEKYRKQVELLRGTENEVSAETQRKQEAAIRKKYGGKPEEKPPFGAITDASGLYKSLFLKTEIASYQELADAEAKAAAEAAKLAAEQDKSFNKWLVEQEQRRLAMNAPLGEAVSTAMGKYLRDIGDQTKFAEGLVTGSFSRMEDAIINFTKTGKLSFGDLWTFMADEFLRNQIRMVEQKYLLDSAGNFDFGKLSGALSGVGGWISGLFSPKANGMPYVPYNGFPAILHEGERVMTRQENQSASASNAANDFSIGTVNVGQGVSRGEVNAAISQALAQQEKRMRRLQREGKFA